MARVHRECTIYSAAGSGVPVPSTADEAGQRCPDTSRHITRMEACTARQQGPGPRLHGGQQHAGPLGLGEAGGGIKVLCGHHLRHSFKVDLGPERRLLWCAGSAAWWAVDGGLPWYVWALMKLHAVSKDTEMWATHLPELLQEKTVGGTLLAARLLLLQPQPLHIPAVVQHPARQPPVTKPNTAAHIMHEQAGGLLPAWHASDRPQQGL